MTDLVLSKPSPSVLSKVNPKPEDLLKARAYLQKGSVFGEIFQKAKDEAWGAPTLAKALENPLTEVLDDTTDIAQYLADEFTQLKEGIFLVSTETGKVIHIVSEDDLYTPPPVAREGSTELVQRPPQLRPDIEAALIFQGYEKNRESNIVQVLKEKYAGLLDISEKVLVSTRSGRKGIVESLPQEFDSHQLLNACGGTSAGFLRHFELISEAPLNDIEGYIYVKGTVQSQSIMGVQDPTTLNLYHNRAVALRSILAQGWVREIASALGYAIKGKPIDVSDLQVHGGFWVMSPDLVRAAKESHPRATILPVYCPTYNILGDAGYLRVPPEFRTLNVEVFDRWEASASLEYELWVDPNAVVNCNLTGISVEPQVLLVT
jgi:hypothetical protein